MSDPCEYEHDDTHVVFEDDDYVQWKCRTCGAEGWYEKEKDE